MVLDTIELREVRGSGRFATLYRAWDRRRSGFVAVKIPVSSGTAEHLELASRIERERRVQEILGDHPGIVRVLQAGQEAGRPVLVLEWIEGPDLGALGRGRQPGAGEIAQAGVQVAEALAHAHARGVVHCDVRPQTVLLDVARGRVKLGHFGSAQVSTEAQRSVRGAGTPAYMSPEQERGRSFLDARSDIYSLGATLYEFATGAVYKVERRPVVDLRPDLPPELAAAIGRCLLEVPDERYPTAAALVEDIRRFASGPFTFSAAPPEEPSRTPLETLPTSPPRGRFAVPRGLIVAAVLILILGAGIVAAGFAPGIYTAEPAPTPRPTVGPTAAPVAVATASPSPSPTPTAPPVAPARTAAPAAPAPTSAPAPVTVTPTTGRPGTAFRIVFTGLPGSVPYTLTVLRPVLGPEESSGTVPASGELVVTYATQLSYQAGTYDVFLAAGSTVRRTTLEVR